jgi:hypothetical protein
LPSSLSVFPGAQKKMAEIVKPVLQPATAKYKKHNRYALMRKNKRSEDHKSMQVLIADEK